MIERLKIWINSQSWFWKLRTWLGKLRFGFERKAYKSNVSATKAKDNARILGAFTWIGVKNLFWVALGLIVLISIEGYIRNNWSWLPGLEEDERKYNIEQLRLYAQLLTAIFSIYFATIGIIISAGYTRLRRDIIQMLTNEQVGSVYSLILVRAAMFCLAATALPLFGFEPGLFVYAVATLLTFLSALALFPLGQRLFNFFDLNQLVRSEIIPSIVNHIEDAANTRNSVSLANHHSKAARQALGQLLYIDDQVKADKERLEEKLPELSNGYTALLLHYLQQKHTIDQNSYWFPRQSKHEQWFLASDSTTSMALRTSSQQMMIKEEPDHHWLENKIVNRLADHIELAFKVGDFDLALRLISRYSTRLSAYAAWFHFDVGMKELKRFKEIIEQAFTLSCDVVDDETSKQKVGIADTWAALGSNFCLETLRRMITFETELKRFFANDNWSKRSLQSLPAFLQIELAFIVERIEFENAIEGRRLSKPKYVQQLAVQKLLQYYSKILPVICDFYLNLVPNFVDSIAKLKMSEAATQVILSSLHSYWKLPSWFDELAHLVKRYQGYSHYSEEQYKILNIDFAEMSEQLGQARDSAIAKLSDESFVGHIFEPKENDELPDHFGQIYFELAEECISAIEKNDESRLNMIFPMFSALAFLAVDSKFVDPILDINEEFRLHLVSTVINDLASILGFAILYGAYFDNMSLSRTALGKFDSWINHAKNKQEYLKSLILLSSTHSFSMGASPRSLIRINWKISFENRVRKDGFEEPMSLSRGEGHPNSTVREFIRTSSDASHLFFAKHIIPQLDTIDFEVDYHIASLVDQLDEEDKEGE